MRSMNSYAASVALSLCLAASLALSGCKAGEKGDYRWGPLVPVDVESSMERDTSPDVPAGDLDRLVGSNSDFAFELYGLLGAEGGNVFFSPHSISQCLAMVRAGAEGDTETQMAEALHFELAEERLYPAMNALDLALDGRNTADVKLSVTNDIWIQDGFTLLPGYLDVLAVHFGAGMRMLDFAGLPEESRQTINNWISWSTEGRIPEILGPEMIGPGTMLVLTNAIYFHGTWKYPFNTQETTDAAFTLPGGEHVTVPMMTAKRNLRYTWGEGFQALEVPYEGEDVVMLVILPDEGRLAEIEGALATGFLDLIDPGLTTNEVSLRMPRFTYETDYDLEEPLISMGMKDAFSSLADFSGMDGTRGLSIDRVVHKAFVMVDEEGTEAAASTAVTMDACATITTDFVMDRPFVFMIRDLPTGAILFLGRVLDPR